MNERLITPEQANEILDSAENGYSVEVWLRGDGADKGLLLVNFNMEGDFDFTLWPVYRQGKSTRGMVPEESTKERGDAWSFLTETYYLSINV